MDISVFLNKINHSADNTLVEKGHPDTIFINEIRMPIEKMQMFIFYSSGGPLSKN